MDRAGREKRDDGDYGKKGNSVQIKQDLCESRMRKVVKERRRVRKRRRKEERSNDGITKAQRYK
jgi:hypothetical protein